MIVFISCIKDMDVIDLAEAMKSNIFRYYGLFKSYVSDRGSLFILDWWSIFYYYWNIKRRLFIIFYPQTDGATEHFN